MLSNSTKDRNLLILSCSQAKRLDELVLPAIERYDGPAFRLLRRFLNQQHQVIDLDIYILSAEFGLISSSEHIPNYDRKLTKARSSELTPSVMSVVQSITNDSNYERLLICLAKSYWKIVDTFLDEVQSNLQFKIATGTSGRKLSILHQWLYGYPSSQFNQKPEQKQSKITIKGVKFDFTNKDIIEIARQALILPKGNPYNYQSWYVKVDEHRISPKWLVSQLTGFPVSSFHSQTARQVLQKLGINVFQELL